MRMKEPTIKVTGSELRNNIQSCLVFAARYSHCRATGAALMTISAIKAAWPDLSVNTKEQLVKESHEASHNLDDWAEFRKFALSHE